MTVPKRGNETERAERFAPSWESEQVFLVFEPPKRKVVQSEECPRKEADDEQR